MTATARQTARQAARQTARPRLRSRGALWLCHWLALSAVVLAAPGLSAQPDARQIERAQAELDLFTDLLATGLGLDGPGGLFGMSVGSIEARYLHGQGAVLEVRSPLANRRQRLSLAALGSTIRELQTGQNPFARVAGAAQPAAPAAATGPVADEALVERLSSRLRSMDYELIVGAALRQAAQSAEALRSLDGIDDVDYADLKAELSGLQRQLQEALADAAAPDEEAVSALRLAAQERADALRDRLALAQADYEQAWILERDGFERSLYRSACDSADELTLVAAQGSLAVVLVGLGDETRRARPDRIHMIPLAALTRCAKAEIESDALQAESVNYDY